MGTSGQRRRSRTDRGRTSGHRIFARRPRTPPIRTGPDCSGPVLATTRLRWPLSPCWDRCWSAPRFVGPSGWSRPSEKKVWVICAAPTGRSITRRARLRPFLRWRAITWAGSAQSRSARCVGTLRSRDRAVTRWRRRRHRVPSMWRRASLPRSATCWSRRGNARQRRHIFWR